MKATLIVVRSKIHRVYRKAPPLSSLNLFPKLRYSGQTWTVRPKEAYFYSVSSESLISSFFLIFLFIYLFILSLLLLFFLLRLVVFDSRGKELELIAFAWRRSKARSRRRNCQKSSVQLARDFLDAKTRPVVTFSQFLVKFVEYVMLHGWRKLLIDAFNGSLVLLSWTVVYFHFSTLRYFTRILSYVLSRKLFPNICKLSNKLFCTPVRLTTRFLRCTATVDGY